MTGAREINTAIAAPPTRDVLAAYRGDCTAWESADRETGISKALDRSYSSHLSADKYSHARTT